MITFTSNVTKATTKIQSIATNQNVLEFGIHHLIGRWFIFIFNGKTEYGKGITKISGSFLEVNILK